MKLNNTVELAMYRLVASILIPTLLLLASNAQADVLYMEDQNRTVMMEAPIEFVDTPYRGMNMAGVRARFGEPKSTDPAVGDPPITRWDYDRFHVFFEHNLVLHAVVPNKPLRIDHQDELQPAPADFRKLQ